MAIGLLLPAALPGTVSASNVSSSEHTTIKAQLEGVLTVKDVINEEYQKYIANTKGSLAFMRRFVLAQTLAMVQLILMSLTVLRVKDTKVFRLIMF
ncbi:hypothetical protein DZB91_19325 [Brevibacillus sp. VP]|nr:hypothetical protein DZB91_19325 [Brevibacillus sp. VP]